jgi:nephrocystin-3
MTEVPSTNPDARVVRVFVSSTFRDMQDEREELVKRIFPQLRKLCDQRGVVWGEVDLRWGITPDEAERGEVLPICLAEIERCRPYFIGLLGERYGWVPDEINPELSDREEWLKEHPGHSVTELEILHGVLNDPTMADHAFFYFRDPSYVDRFAADRKGDFVESPTSTEIQRYGLEEAERRAEKRRQKLLALKERLRRSNLPVRTNYADPAALGRMVLQDLTEVINRKYPEGSIPDPLDRESAEHEAFAASRSHVYIKREADFQRLDAYSTGSEQPLVLLGESGVGKSALLANWALEYRQRHPETPVILHFIGASPDSADWAALTRRIIGELKRTFHLDLAIPEDPEQLRRVFVAALTASAERRRVVLVLDGLNQLVDSDGAPDLVWLPAEMPANIRLVVSTLPGRSLDEIQRRNWPSMEVAPLRAPERKKLIGDYLAQYTKKLDAQQIAKIAGARPTGNPLYLRALLEELRVFGEHERLEERIDHYLSAKSVPTLYKRILERYEQDYDHYRPGLTRDAMSLLWASRRGLAESELMDLLGSGGEAFARAYWSPLFLAAEQGFVSRGGLLNFSHDYLRQAVGSRYLSRKEARHEVHSRLADYFAGRGTHHRRIDEQPWQLSQAGDWNRLYYLLSDLSFFAAAWKRSRSEVMAYWTQVEAHSELRITDAFERLIDRLASLRTPYVPLGWQPTLQMAQLMPEPPPDENHLWSLSELLSDRGHSKGAMRIREWLRDRFEATGDRGALSAALGGQAHILKSRGQLDEAYSLFKQQEDMSRETGKQDSLIGSLIGQAQILESKGRLDEAVERCVEAERISVESGNRLGVMSAIGNRASLLYLRGQDDEALGLFKQQERIARELDDRHGLYVVLSNQGLLLEARDRAEDALTLFKQSESIARDLGNRKGIAASLGHQAKILFKRGEYDRALRLLDDNELICRELGDQVGLSIMLHHRGEIARRRGDRMAAVDYYREEERIARQFDYQSALFNSLTGQARVHQESGRYDQALRQLGEAESICRESPLQLASVLRQQSLVLKDQREFDEALKKLVAAEHACERVGNKHELLTVLTNEAALHMERNDFPRALEVLRRGEPLAASLNDQRDLEICKGGIAGCLGILGDHYADNGRITEAKQCYSELETRARELGDTQQLQRSLESQADLLTRSGDVAGAQTKLEESEQLDRASGDRRLLAQGLLKQAAILVDAGIALDKAQVKAQEAATIFDELNMNLHSAQAGAILVRIRSGLSGRVIKFVGIGFLLLLAGGGVALGMWKTWLWIVGGPIVFFAAFNLLLTLVPPLQRRYNDFVKRVMSSGGR